MSSTIITYHVFHSFAHFLYLDNKYLLPCFRDLSLMVIGTELQSRIPPSRYPLPPPASRDLIMECRIKVLYFFIYDNNRVKLYWLGQSPCPDKIGDVPVIVIRLREDYVPRNTVESRLSWKACFHILRMRFGAQFCFTFQIGKRGIQNWCFPRILWVPGVDSDLNKLCPVNPWDREQMQSWINAQYSRPVRLEGRGGKKSAYTLPSKSSPPFSW